NDRAQRTEEAADENALPPVRHEIGLAAIEEAGVLAQRPHPANRIVVSVAEPVADAVAEDRADDRRGGCEPWIERLQSHEHAGGKYDRATRYYRTNDRRRLEERRREHRAERQ